jgi:hypothetical protein
MGIEAAASAVPPALGAPAFGAATAASSDSGRVAAAPPPDCARGCPGGACVEARALGREAALFMTLILASVVIYGSVAITAGRLTPVLRQALDAMGFLFSAFFAIASGRGRRYFGVTLDGSRRAIREGLLLALVLAPSAVPVRLALDRLGLMPPGTPLLSFSASKLTVLYFCLTVPLEEFVHRGVIQTYVRELWGEGRAGTIAPVASAATLFAFYHVANTPMFALLVLPPAIAWGLLYERHRTLVGVAVSHAVVGWVAFDVLSLGKALLPGS